jgi:hypothetical protein
VLDALAVLEMEQFPRLRLQSRGDRSVYVLVDAKDRFQMRFRGFQQVQSVLFDLGERLFVRQDVALLVGLDQQSAHDPGPGSLLAFINEGLSIEVEALLARLDQHPLLDPVIQFFPRGLVVAVPHAQGYSGDITREGLQSSLLLIVDDVIRW